jgi:hypothetical protein
MGGIMMRLSCTATSTLHNRIATPLLVAWIYGSACRLRKIISIQRHCRRRIACDSPNNGIRGVSKSSESAAL